MIKISRSQYLEIAAHLLLWLLYFTSVNVDWTANWWDKSLRPHTPAPLTVLIFPVFCYANALWLVPRYFNLKNWYRYLLWGMVIYLMPELLRAGLSVFFDPQASFSGELTGRDSFIPGAPGAFFPAMNVSFGYRFTKDWFINRRIIQHLRTKTKGQQKEKAASIPEPEVARLMTRLQVEMEAQQLYLDPNLSLRDLADRLQTTDKKLSQLLNQHLATNFYDYINSFRIARFKEKMSTGLNEQLSIVGLAMDCGFRSKSSFYRAFRKEVGLSPTEYQAGLST
jgi:AraC-like DNA-binding protein